MRLCQCVCAFAMTITRWRAWEAFKVNQRKWRTARLVWQHWGLSRWSGGGGICHGGLRQNLLVQKGEKREDSESHQVGQEAEDRIQLPLPSNSSLWKGRRSTLVANCHRWFYSGTKTRASSNQGSQKINKKSANIWIIILLTKHLSELKKIFSQGGKSLNSQAVRTNLPHS